MELTLAWLLPIYAILVFIALLLAAVDVFHLVRFGGFDRRNHVAAVVFTLAVFGILFFSAGYLLRIDWQQSVDISLPSVTLPTIPQP